MKTNMIQCPSLIFNLLIPIALVLAPSAAANSQTTTLAPTTTESSITTRTSLQDTPTAAPQTTTTSTSTEAPTTTGVVLLSANEFVDFTEAPTLLFDGISNNTANNETATTTTPQPPITINETTTPAAIAVASSTASPTPAAATPQSPTPAATVEPEPENVDDSEGGSGGEEDEQGGHLTSSGDAKDPLQQPYEPPKNVSQYMDYIERLFHDLRHQITDLFEPHIPQLIRTSQMVQLSGSCSYDMLRMALALRQFEPWALRMIDSSGKVPEGIFEGSFTALGSYDECISTVFASKGVSASDLSATNDPDNEQQQQQPKPTQGKYCLVNVSPFLPPKPPADKVELMFQEEANRRNYTKDDQFSRLSPMFYYMKFRIGVCVPSTCIDSDLESISSALSSSLRLNITIPHCRMKQSQPITGHQMVGGLIFALVLTLVCTATLMDYWRRKLDRLERHDRLLVLGSVASAGCSEQRIKQPLPIIWHRQKQHCDATSGCDGGNPQKSTQLPVRKFDQRLDRHWSWMSFSLLTNYKLYFKSISSIGSKSAPGQIDKNDCDDGEPSAMVIRCLNGIRVISLCWVIIANSYITLDPRATKRLTKTREAPKDFLFQLVAQASLAIETFFFLSGVLLSLSFARQLKPDDYRLEKEKQSEESGNRKRRSSYFVQWIRFYVHRYVRMTPPTMLVIAFTMFAFRYGDGPLWFEATHKAHEMCSKNWWRHLLHVANFIDTRSMCFIHYWYIAADMQLFLFAPLLMFLLYQRKRIGYALTALIGSISIGTVFYTTYSRNLPPTLLFYNSDPESRREFGNTIMTKPLTHALPYMVGMLVGKWLSTSQVSCRLSSNDAGGQLRRNGSLRTLIGLIATSVALAEVFLPYKWNNSHLPTRFLASLYASLFRLCWSLVLAYLVVSCAHPRGKRCPNSREKRRKSLLNNDLGCPTCQSKSESTTNQREVSNLDQARLEKENSFGSLCFCGYGGNLVNRLLSLNVFAHLSRLSFVAYLIHLPLMSVFIAQTRGLFAFSHTLVIHLALSYLVMTFILSFILVHIIEFPFITFERYLFKKLFSSRSSAGGNSNNRTSDQQQQRQEDKVPLPPLIMMMNNSNQQQWATKTTTRPEHEPRKVYNESADSENYRMSERL